MLLVACGDDGRPRVDASTDSGPVDGAWSDGERPDAAVDASADDASPDTDASMPYPGCDREPAAEDRTRYVVVSHPFGASGSSPRFEVLTLSADGELSVPGTTFELGDRPTGGGEIAFTPDGQVGLVALDDGTLGAFTLDEAGTPTVTHAGFAGPFYAGGVVVDPSGSRAYVLDHDAMPERGGGVYEVAIRCDGTLVDMGRVLAAAGPRVLRFGDDDGMLLTARSVDGGGAAGDDVYALSRTPPFGFVGGVDAFGDDDAITTEIAITADGRFALVADNSLISVNRVAVVGLDGASPTAVQVLSPIPDPFDVVTSPFGDSAIVISGVDGDAILALDYDPMDTATPFSIRGELTYVGTNPQLPANAVLVDRGGLKGLVLVAENVAVRRVRFEPGGEVTDLGAFGLGGGVEAIVGILGVTP
jgi:hypothetical protein